MIFYGMPRQNSEYIQASSRAGRSHVGIVFTCLHPVRERDQSHYAYFVKFHEFLGQLIEPVAINRWSKFSINRTLPGLFMGVLLQVVANRPGVGNPNRYYMLDFVRGEISNGNLREKLEKLLVQFSLSPEIVSELDLLSYIEHAQVHERPSDVVDFLCELAFLGMEVENNRFEFLYDEENAEKLNAMAVRNAELNPQGLRRFRINRAYHRFLEVKPGIGPPPQQQSIALSS
jgi:hypothetical protein